MALSDRIRPSRPLSVYLAVLGVVLLLIAGASMIWSSTEVPSTSPPAQTAP